MYACKAKTGTGAPCKAPVAKNGPCALHAEPSRASDLGRRSGKARRYVVQFAEQSISRPSPRTAQDVRKVLGEVMSDLRGRRLDPRVASAMAYESKYSAECICFPENEQPFFGLPIEEQIAAKVKCPIHGDRFKPIFHIYVPKWRRENEKRSAGSV